MTVSDQVHALSDAELLERLTAAHAGVLVFLRQALHHAREAGEILTEFHERIPHGQWLEWLRDHRISYSTAANYRRVFERWSDVEAHLQDDASFTLTDAVKLLAVPRQPAGDAPEQLVFPDGTLYSVPMVADWDVVLKSMPREHVVRSRDAILAHIEVARAVLAKAGC